MKRCSANNEQFIIDKLMNQDFKTELPNQK